MCLCSNKDAGLGMHEADLGKSRPTRHLHWVKRIFLHPILQSRPLCESPSESHLLVALYFTLLPSSPHCDCHCMITFTMFPSRAANAAKIARQTRQFSTTSPIAAISPYRKHTAQPVKETKRNVSATAKSNAQAAAQPAPAQQRAVPSPAFNRDEPKSREPQPLQPFRQPEMDHSFVGMKGGEIFHEMMLRHNVKHVCKCSPGGDRVKERRGSCTSHAS